MTTRTALITLKVLLTLLACLALYITSVAILTVSYNLYPSASACRGLALLLGGLDGLILRWAFRKISRLKSNNDPYVA